MTGMTGLGLVLGVLAVATLVGMLWRSRQGRVSAPGTSAPGMSAPGMSVPGTSAHGASALLPTPVLARVDGAAAVTLLQLTAPICAQCPQVRTLLTELVAATPGVRHVELDLAEHPGLAGELGIRSTPTTLAISRTGHELFRVTGVPRRAELLSALQPHL